MPSILELAQISQAAYYPGGGQVSGWSRTQAYEDTELGLAATTYINKKTNEMVIAFRGANTAKFYSLIQNLYTATQVAFGLIPNTFPPAHQLIKQTRAKRTVFQKIVGLLTSLKKNKLTLTGHSLGALLAELSGIEFMLTGKNYKVTTFESPGSRYLIAEDVFKKHELLFKKNFTTYLGNPNPINTFNSHLGSVIHVQLRPYKGNFVSKAYYYGEHASQCIINDILRFSFLLMLLNLIFVSFSEQPILPNYVTDFSATYLSSHLSAHGYNMQSSSGSTNFAMEFFTLLILTKFTFSVKNSVSSILQQHPIGKFVTHFQHPQANSKCKLVKKWPNKKEFALSHADNTARWFKFFSKETPNMRTLFTDPVKLERHINAKYITYT